MALSLAETCWRAAGDLTGWLPGSGTAVWSAGGMPGSVFLAGEIQVAVVAAFLLTAALYLLGRGSLYPLWMAILALFGMLAGFLGSIDYAQPWQNDGMALALYLTAAGILICQQVSCTRQELERAFWEWGRGEGPGGSEAARNKGNREESAAGVPESSAGSLRKGLWGQEAQGGKGRKISGASAQTSASPDRDWREAADRELRQLQIFEHDFRHHLDMLAVLYEDGNPAEARVYVDDLKQSRASRQGQKIGGERELSYIMMAKREVCRQAGISFSYQIVGSPRGITQMDMTALLLNLLDNGIRACREAPQPRSISVMLLSRGELWEIEMTNSGRYEPDRRAGKDGKGKADGAVHGIGMVSVGRIVEKYQGRHRIWQEDGVVRQKLILVQRLPQLDSE